MDDTALQECIAHAAAGDNAAFRRLYDHLEPRVFAYIVSRSPRRDIAIDVTQDVFIAFYQSLQTFRFTTVPQFYAFVFVIVRRSLSAFYRNKHTQQAKQNTPLLDDDLADRSIDSAVSDEVEVALRSLDATTRDIIVLHHWSRYTFGEIAAILKMQESAVRTRHHRGIKQLEPLLTHT
jgi:RNA polymerase sigma-70 factor, ECF subfamily